MSSTNNFYKNANKIRHSNLYSLEGYRGSIIGESLKAKSSISPTRLFNLKDYNKSSKNNSFLPMMNSYNNHPYKLMDNDKLMEELINHKNELNKKNKEFHNLKISFLKLDEENKKNIKIIEDIIIEAGRGKKDGEMSNLSPEELENEIKNIMAYTHPSDKMLYKLKESYIINNLKRQLYEYKLSLEAKEEEIANLRINGRVSKYHDLEAKMKAAIDELITLKNNYNILLNSYNDKEIKMKELLDERDHLKSLSAKYKGQNDDFREKTLAFQDLNMKLNDQIRSLEEKINNWRYQHITLNKMLKEKENEISDLKEELLAVEKFRLEKEKNEKLIVNLTSSLSSLKEDLERKTKKLRELEKVNLELRMPSEDTFENRSFRNNKSENSLEKIREKIIKSLEIENKKLRDHIKSINYENFKKMEFDIENNVEKSLHTSPDHFITEHNDEKSFKLDEGKSMNFNGNKHHDEENDKLNTKTSRLNQKNRINNHNISKNDFKINDNEKSQHLLSHEAFDNIAKDFSIDKSKPIINGNEEKNHIDTKIDNKLIKNQMLQENKSILKYEQKWILDNDNKEIENDALFIQKSKILVLNSKVGHELGNIDNIDKIDKDHIIEKEDDGNKKELQELLENLNENNLNRDVKIEKNPSKANSKNHSEEQIEFHNKKEHNTSKLDKSEEEKQATLLETKNKEINEQVYEGEEVHRNYISAQQESAAANEKSVADKSRHYEEELEKDEQEIENLENENSKDNNTDAIKSENKNPEKEEKRKQINISQTLEKKSVREKNITKDISKDNHIPDQDKTPENKLDLDNVEEQPGYIADKSNI